MTALEKTERGSLKVQTAALRLLNDAYVLMVWLPYGTLEHANAESHAERIVERLRPILHVRLRECPMVVFEGDVRSERMPVLYSSRAKHPAVEKAWIRGHFKSLVWSPMVVPR